MLQAQSPSAGAAVLDSGQESEIEALHRCCGVYTNPKVVCRILDAVGWTEEVDLSEARLLEPAAGNGAFVVEAARRLAASYSRHGMPLLAGGLSKQIKAYEFHRGAIQQARQRTISTLCNLGIQYRTAAACAKAWFDDSDFLLTPASRIGFTHTVGNPPYIRWSKIPVNLRASYAAKLPREMTGGDLFLPFLDHALEQLRPEGRCGFLCSDRWRFMAFAEAFRRKWLPVLDVISDEPLSAREAFVSKVDTYPTILTASKRLVANPRIIAHSTRNGTTLRDLGCNVKVGPALGHTPAFVLEPHEQDVEPEILHPWIDSSEISEGSVNWRGRHVITMYNEKGELIDLQQFPLLAKRLERFEPQLRQRSIVRNGAAWYQTIDRVRATDWLRPKLVVPELAKIPRLAIDRSGTTPSHGVYAIFAKDDDVEALYAKLRDGKLAQALQGIAPKVKGGYVRCYKRFLLNALVSEA